MGPQTASRHAGPSVQARRSAAGSAHPSISGARLAGVLFLLAALLRPIEHHVLSRWWEATGSGSTEVYSTSFFLAVFGLALLQRSQGARRAVLWLLGLVTIAAAGGGALLFALQPELASVWAWILGPALLTTVGFIGLLSREDHSRGTAALGAAVVLAGLATSMWGLISVSQRSSPEFAREVEQWSLSDRQFADADSGLSVRVPDGWVVLKPGNPILKDEPATMALAQPTMGGLAVLRVESHTELISNDHCLDAMVEARRQRVPSLKEVARSDKRVGTVTGRAVATSWVSDEGRRFFGLTTAWRDLRTQFSLSIALPTREGAADETEKLISAVSFEAPQAKQLASTTEAVTALCPMLSKAAVAAMTKSMPRDAVPADYFRQAYVWASRGATLLDAKDASELAASMSAMLERLNHRERSRLNDYLERVRAGHPSTAADDAAVAAVVRSAVLELNKEAQDRLRKAFEQAVEVGRLM